MKFRRSKAFYFGMAGVVAFAAATAVGLYSSKSSARANKSEAVARASAAALVAETRAGYSCRNSIEVGYLGQGESFTIDTTLYHGNEYLIVGAGDSQIRDLDLEIYDRNWEKVAADTMVDPVPTVNVVARFTGRVHVKVIAYDGEGWATAVFCYK